MIDALLSVWYLWILVILAAIYKFFRPVIKGYLGERTITRYLNRLPKDEYTILANIMLNTGTGTTQIDHIVVSLYGIFIIETKNYKGWIFGDEMAAQWTQNIYGNKRSFMNPLRQNYAHVKAVEAHLEDFGKVPIIPIVAFSADCDLKIKSTSHVVYFHRVNGVILHYRKKAISDIDIATIVEILRSQDVTSVANKKEHVNAINTKKSDIEAAAEGKCPNCSGMLVSRKGKFGSFLGCSNYPGCKFTRQL